MYRKAVLSLIVILIVGVLNALIFFVQYRRDLERKTIETYERQLTAIEELMISLRRKQHDYDNHIQAIKSCFYNIERKKIEKYKEFESLSQYVDDVEKDDKLIRISKLKNLILAGFLYSKFEEADKRKINVECDISNHQFELKIKNHELVMILGILIDNAFEATKKGSLVHLSLSGEYNELQVDVLNKYPKVDPCEVKNMFELGYSTKSVNGRGLGLSNLNRIVKKNDGVIQVSNVRINDDNYIKFSVIVR